MTELEKIIAKGNLFLDNGSADIELKFELKKKKDILLDTGTHFNSIAELLFVCFYHWKAGVHLKEYIIHKNKTANLSNFDCFSQTLDACLLHFPFQDILYPIPG